MINNRHIAGVYASEKAGRHKLDLQSQVMLFIYRKIDSYTPCMASVRLAESIKV
jgi:hypothetical protein